MSGQLAVHNDLPTLCDYLKWESDLQRMAQRIVQCKPPHVFGIHGDWGCGKTSFMRQLQQKLGGVMPVRDGSLSDEPPSSAPSEAVHAVTVWFDAWRYQNEAMPVAALIHEMHRQLPMHQVVKKELKKLGTVVSKSILDNFSAVAKAVGIEGMFDTGKVEAHGVAWEKAHFDETLPTNAICDHLHQTVKALLPKSGANQGQAWRVVVFIDDIDRCNPKAAMRLLEGLKIYLQIPDCVFVLGMNERVLVKVIQDEVFLGKAAGEDKSQLALHAAHYLEKMCTDIYRLPLPRDPKRLFCHWIGNDMGLLFPAVNPHYLPPNPRRLKALANQFLRLAHGFPKPLFGEDSAISQAEQATEQQIWAASVLIVAYVYQFHREIWERWYFDATVWDKLLNWCSGSNDSNEWQVASHLSLPVSGSHANSRDPGDIAIFWIGNLVRGQARINADKIHQMVIGSGAEGNHG